MKHTVTDRGFKHLEPFTCNYGTTVKVYESSSAEAPHIWLRLQQGGLRTSGDTSVGGALEVSEAVAHLSLEEAKQLRDQLDWLMDNHYQL